MAITYESIATTTLGSAAASYTFSSIPSTYTDLVIVGQGTLSADGGWAVRFNGDTASNYSSTVVYGDGTSAASARAVNDTSMGLGYGGTAQGTNIFHIQNYSNSTTYKSALSRQSGNGYVAAKVGLWRNTSAITSITALTYSGNFAVGSTFTLYGIKGA